MSLETKLTYLDGTKTAIRNAINTRLSDVPAVSSNTTFRDYAARILAHQCGAQGGGGGTPAGVTDVPSMDIFALSDARTRAQIGDVYEADPFTLTSDASASIMLDPFTDIETGERMALAERTEATLGGDAREREDIAVTDESEGSLYESAALELPAWTVEAIGVNDNVDVVIETAP